MSLARGRSFWRWGGGMVLLVGLLLVAGCFGGDDGGVFIGRSTPTPTRAPFVPRSPVAGTPSTAQTPTPVPTPTPTAPIGGTPIAEVTPIAPFEITVDDAVNVREGPSTQSAILRIIVEGERKRVIGQVLGEEATPGSGNRIWYQLEEGGFVYSGVVEKVTQ